MQRIIAVYGTLKKGHHNHYLLRDSKLISKGKTKPCYTMYSAGGFPIVSTTGNTEIHVELYEINDESVSRNINRLEGYTGTPGDPNNWYDVTTVDVNGITAEMFVMHNVKNSPVVEGGNW